MQAYIKMEKLECRPRYIKHGCACNNAEAPITRNDSKTDPQQLKHASSINMENTSHQRMTDFITTPISSVITVGCDANVNSQPRVLNVFGRKSSTIYINTIFTLYSTNIMKACRMQRSSLTNQSF